MQFPLTRRPLTKQWQMLYCIRAAFPRFLRLTRSRPVGSQEKKRPVKNDVTVLPYISDYHQKLLKGRFFPSLSGLRTSTEIVTRHYIDLDNGIPLNIHARPRLIGRRPNAIVNIETDVFQEKSYKQYSSQHLRDALIAVKKGYSVYAASNKYGVPRKTLRNWMAKYDIKSQFSKGRRGTRTNPILDPLDLMEEARSERFEGSLQLALQSVSTSTLSPSRHRHTTDVSLKVSHVINHRTHSNRI